MSEWTSEWLSTLVWILYLSGPRCDDISSQRKGHLVGGIEVDEIEIEFEKYDVENWLHTLAERCFEMMR